MTNSCPNKTKFDNTLHKHAWKIKTFATEKINEIAIFYRYKCRPLDFIPGPFSCPVPKDNEFIKYGKIRNYGPVFLVRGLNTGLWVT